MGLLPRLDVEAVGYPVHIGKESNRLDNVEDGLIAHAGGVYVEYRDEHREREAARPALRLREEQGRRYMAEMLGLSDRVVRYALNGGKLPRPAARRKLLACAAYSWSGGTQK